MTTIPSNGCLSFQFSLRSWFFMRRLIRIPRTDDNRLVDIRISNPYRADYTIVLSEQPAYSTPLQRIFQSMYCYIESNKLMFICLEVYEFFIIGRRGTLPPRNELRGIRYPCTLTGAVTSSHQ